MTVDAHPRQAPTRRRRTISAARLVAATRSVIAANGLRGAQARPIAEAAGCSIGTLYNLFGDLDTLILRANAETLAELEVTARAACDQARRDGLAPVERLIALALGYVEFAEACRSHWSAVFDFRRPPDDSVPPWYAERTAGLFGLLEEAIADLPGVTPAARAETARTLWAATHGIVIQALAGRIGPVDAANVRCHVEGLVRTLAAGMAATASPARRS